jgi:hypothetical protein
MASDKRAMFFLSRTLAFGAAYWLPMLVLTPVIRAGAAGGFWCSLQNTVHSLYTISMSQEPVFTDNRGYLLELARKYLWWENAQSMLGQPYRILAAAMNLGSLDDYQRLYRTFGPAFLVKAIQQKVPGWFSAKSWSFWYRVLDLVEITDMVPQLPQRVIR